MKSLVVASFVLVSSAAHAKILTAGAGMQYPKPCDAIAAAVAGDEVDVSPGTYTDTCDVNADNVVIKGVGGRPIFDSSATDHPADYKGVFVVNGNGVRLENLEVMGAHIPVDQTYGGNGAAVRVQGDALVIHGCYFHDNQNGVLAMPASPGGTITIENTELAKNGVGNACDVVSCTHNAYLGEYAHAVFQYNWSHDIANDTPDKGHLLKSRAARTDVLYNRLTGQSGLDSYEVDLPNGGLAIVVGNVIEKGANAGNPTLLNYGEEGLSQADHRLFVVGNTFVNDLGHGTFISVASGATLTAFDNLLVGSGTPSSTGALSADNLAGIDPLFVDAASFDYHLTAASPARGKAVAPGSADTTSLVPAFEYVQPTGATPRAAQSDVGAYEYGTVTSPVDGGTTQPSDGGVLPAGDAGTPTTDGGTTATKDHGGCSMASQHVGTAWLWLLGLAAIVATRSRAARRR